MDASAAAEARGMVRPPKSARAQTESGEQASTLDSILKQIGSREMTPEQIEVVQQKPKEIADALDPKGDGEGGVQ